MIVSDSPHEFPSTTLFARAKRWLRVNWYVPILILAVAQYPLLLLYILMKTGF